MKSLLGIVLITIVIILFACTPNKPLPILGNSPIADFSFLNQDSITITNETFKDKVYIADFFFTSCTTICPHMHRIMKEIFDEHKDNQSPMFLSHTIDYKYDTPSKLKKYAEKLGIYNNNWQFAYGTKESIYDIAEHSYLSAVIEDNNTKENYIHQGYLLLIDKQRRMRGAYDSSNPDQIAKLERDLEVLLAE